MGFSRIFPNLFSTFLELSQVLASVVLGMAHYFIVDSVSFMVSVHYFIYSNITTLLHPAILSLFSLSRNIYHIHIFVQCDWQPMNPHDTKTNWLRFFPHVVVFGIYISLFIQRSVWLSSLFVCQTISTNLIEIWFMCNITFRRLWTFRLVCFFRTIVRWPERIEQNKSERNHLSIWIFELIFVFVTELWWRKHEKFFAWK